jgi:hypothetical protein
VIAAARDLLTTIGGAARPAGSDAEEAARRVCADWLSQLGFVVEYHPFTYSALPGMWGTPVAGLVLLATALLSGLAVWRGAAVESALSGDVAVLGAVTLAGWWIGRHGTRSLPFLRRSAVNLEARRGVPLVWFVAHLDSKSQPISLLVRSSAAVAAACTWAAVLALWIAARWLPVPAATALALLALAALFSVPLLLSWTGSASAGALDNASGVASVLEAARLVDLAAPVGIVVTSAEEFGLAGARAWVADKEPGVAINCDGVDDLGALTITTGRVGRDLWRLPCADALAGAPARLRRSLPGVLLDATAFSQRGWTACTVSIGTRRSLARVHTAQDTMDRLAGSSVDRAARLIASLAGAVIARA